jgi:hypothetical protein
LKLLGYSGDEPYRKGDFLVVMATYAESSTPLSNKKEIGSVRGGSSLVHSTTANAVISSDQKAKIHWVQK